MYFGLWVAFAVLVAFVGRERKIGFWSTLILSLLLSPLVGLIIALLSKPRPVVIQSKVTVSESKTAVGPRKCSYCGFDDRTGVPFCPGCGKDASGKTTEDYKSIAANSQYVAQQEAKLKAEKEAKERVQKQSNKRLFQIAIVLFILVALLVLYGYITDTYF